VQTTVSLFVKYLKFLYWLLNHFDETDVGIERVKLGPEDKANVQHDFVSLCRRLLLLVGLLALLVALV
jgi:hypothetical protein